jgi:hypothetical protein
MRKGMTSGQTMVSKTASTTFAYFLIAQMPRSGRMDRRTGIKFYTTSLGAVRQKVALGPKGT